MTSFPSTLVGDFGSKGSGQFVGFGSRLRGGQNHIATVIGNLGFLYNLRTGVLHVRLMSSLKGKSDAR